MPFNNLKLMFGCNIGKYKWICDQQYARKEDNSSTPRMESGVQIIINKSLFRYST